ncbi:MAG: hypothetical protein AAF639_36725 [Chloroflexota bacterium]
MHGRVERCGTDGLEILVNPETATGQRFRNDAVVIGGGDTQTIAIPSEQGLAVTVVTDAGSTGEAMVSTTLLNEANQVFLPLNRLNSHFDSQPLFATIQSIVSYLQLL